MPQNGLSLRSIAVRPAGIIAFVILVAAASPAASTRTAIPGPAPQPSERYAPASKTLPAFAPAMRLAQRVAQFDDIKISDFSATAGQRSRVAIVVPPQRPELKGGTLMIRGLPDTMSLSAGTRQAGNWVVPLAEIANLMLVSPPNYEGKLDLFLALAKADGTPVVQRIVTVGFSAPGVAATAAVPAARPSPANAAPDTVDSLSGSRSPALSAAEETTLIDSGLTLMKQGQIAAARLIFEELEKLGSARGTFALAQTFDPSFLKRPMISAIKPDMNTARRLYEKAVALGSSEAAQRLTELDQR